MTSTSLRRSATLATSYSAVPLYRSRFSWNFYIKNTHSLPVRTRYGVSWVGSHVDIYFAPLSAVMYAISCDIGSCYNGTRLYYECPVWEPCVPLTKNDTTSLGECFLCLWHRSLPWTWYHIVHGVVDRHSGRQSIECKSPPFRRSLRAYRIHCVRALCYTSGHELEGSYCSISNSLFPCSLLHEWSSARE